MRKCLLLFLGILSVLLASCEKLDMSPSSANNSEEEVVNANDTVHISIYTCEDILEGNIAQQFADSSTLKLPNSAVEGYIVGFVSGSSISSATFATGETETNIILADSPEESSAQRCVPVQLSKTGASNTVRQALNLHNNPDMYLAKVRINGTLEKYMRTVGLKNVKGYEIISSKTLHN